MIDSLITALPLVAPELVAMLSPTGAAYAVTGAIATGVAHFAASTFVATTNTPNEETSPKWAVTLYKIAEAVALAVGKAKDK